MINDENTPIEEYTLSGKKVYVKRDDLFLASRQPMVPALAKLRGARVVLKKLKEEGVRKIACFDTRISKSGQGIAYLCQELELECAVGYPRLVSDMKLNEPQEKAQLMGAKVFPVEAGRTNICYHAFKRKVEELGYYVLPLGITFKETASEVAKISEKIEKFGSIVVATGTATIACGISIGNREVNVVGVSCGMSPQRQGIRIGNICSALRIEFPKNLCIYESGYDYYGKAETIGIPFPSSPYYDAKAWWWLERMIESGDDSIKEPILFWNIGV